MRAYNDFKIPRRLVEFILLGPIDDRRQLQDSPILGDVWIKYGQEPGKHLWLLLTPHRDDHPGELAKALYQDVEATQAYEPDEQSPADRAENPDDDEPEFCDVAFLGGLVAARLTFPQLIGWVVPKTDWWLSSHSREVTDLIADADSVTELVKFVVEQAKEWRADPESSRLHDIAPIKRFVALAAMLCWACDYHTEANPPTNPDDHIDFVLDWIDPGDAADSLLAVVAWADETDKPLVHNVSLDRRAWAAVAKSVLSVKADAAQSLFSVNCEKITWAILDSGIDGRHSAFLNDKNTSRIKSSYDFGHFRNIVSMNNSKPAVLRRNIEVIRNVKGLKQAANEQQIESDLKQLAKDAMNLAPINWEIVKRYIEIDTSTPPPTPHGTHVAGILGARKCEQTNGSSDDDANQSLQTSNGMCPEIGLLDLRVLGRTVKESEFAIIAALQFLRYLNERGSMMAVHGANLSLSIPHDVRNFACGRTPICDECERLVNSGVVVVAAAGNHGYKNYLTDEGPFANFAAFSITDPGNADSVLTVGSTHRIWPHTYGVSFFSSRGPTGDGRVKPDLVAPGERIHAPLSLGESGEERWGDLDGTSMAAPHVSGAAAMLMARYPELAGQPRRIKQILMDSATDLGRTPTFQGRGMLDVLRAFQSI